MSFLDNNFSTFQFESTQLDWWQKQCIEMTHKSRELREGREKDPSSLYQSYQFLREKEMPSPIQKALITQLVNSKNKRIRTQFVGSPKTSLEEKCLFIEQALHYGHFTSAGRVIEEMTLGSEKILSCKKSSRIVQFVLSCSIDPDERLQEAIYSIELLLKANSTRCG